LKKLLVVDGELMSLVVMVGICKEKM